MAITVSASAQVASITFDTKDFKDVSVYDNWENSPFRTGILQGNAQVVDNPDTSVDPTLGKAPDATAKVVAVERSKYGSNTFGVRIDLNEPFRMTKNLQYIHVMALMRDKPVASKMMVIGLGKRVEEAWSWQDGTDEQFWALSASSVQAGNGWQDVVFSFKGFSYSKAEKPGNGIDIYSLVIIPDVSSPTADMQNWAAYFDEIVVDNNPGKRFSTEKYAVSFDKEATVTRTDRHLDGIGLTEAGGTLQSATGFGKHFYDDVTKTAIFSATAGKKITPKVNYTGNYMSAYVYTDWNSNGVFDAGTEMIATTGTGNTVHNAMAAFTIPSDTQTGFYRMRYKVDWNSTDPAGNSNSNNLITNNGGAIVDVTLDIHEANVTVNQSQLNGNIYLNDGNNTVLSNYQHPYGTPMTVKIAPADGFTHNGFTLRYGHNIDQNTPQTDDNGNPNYIEVLVPASAISADGTYEIPGEYMRGGKVMLTGDMQSVNQFTVVILGVPEGQGSVTYAGKTYTNGQIIEASQFFSAEDVEVNPVDGYALRSKELSGKTLTVTYAELKTGTRITTLDQLSNTKAYYIHSTNGEGYLCYNPAVTAQYVSLRGVTKSGTVGNSTYKDAVDPFDKDNSWQILNDGGKYYLYNVGQKKFVTRNGRDYIFTDELTALDGIRAAGNGVFAIHAGGDMSETSTYYACIVMDTAPQGVRNWRYDDHGSTLWFTENPNIEVEDILDTYPNVTYNYYFNGDKKGSETIKTKKGNFYPEPTTLPDFTTYTLPTENVTENTTLDIEVEAATPFHAAPDAASISTWYNIAIKSTNYWTVGSDARTISLTGKPAETDDNGKWGFVGNPFDGYYVYSAAKNGAVLTSPIDVSTNTGGNTYPFVQQLAGKTSSQVNIWRITKSSHATDGFFMAQDGYPGSRLNLRDGKLAFWTAGAGAGSTVTVQEVSLPTGISDIAGNTAVRTGCYDLNGRRQDMMQAKGIIITKGKKYYK